MSEKRSDNERRKPTSRRNGHRRSEADVIEFSDRRMSSERRQDERRSGVERRNT